MSYSFSVRGATKEDVLDKVRVKMAEVVSQQPIHEKDQAQAVSNAGNVIALLTDDPTADINVSANGYLSWTDLDHKIRQANVCATASIVDKEVPK